MYKKLIVLFLLVFALGWFCNSLYTALASELSYYDITFNGLNTLNSFNTGQKPLQPSSKSDVGLVTIGSKEVISPKDRISEEQIHIYPDRVIISLSGAQWSTFTDTNSMDPVIDAGANAIQIVPKHPDEVDIGDIVSYQSNYTDGIIIHRVIDKGVDEEGVYFILKGDNNLKPDPGRIRFEQIKRVVVAIVY